MLRTFTVPGPPVAKGRPRLGKYVTYTPTKTVSYKNLAQFSYLEKFKDRVLLEGDLKLEIMFYFPILLRVKLFHPNKVKLKSPKLRLKYT